MSICFTPYIRDAARDTWTIPPVIDDDPDAFELSLATGNGIDILLALGLAPQPFGEPVPIDAFAGLITAALRRHLGRSSPELTATETNEPGRLTLISCGRREGYIEERLGDLARRIQNSRAAGATHFGWS